MNEPLVSVIIPSYNAGRFMAEALDSVLGQTYRNLEVIVVDDGSTDNTAEIVGRYAETVQFVRMAHTGMPGLVRNGGIDRARGELIAFIDADDVWMKDKLATQVELLQRRPEVGLVHTNLQVIDESGHYMREIFLGCPGSQGLSDDYPESSFTQLMKGDSGIWTSSVVVRAACLADVGKFDGSLPVAEDWHLWIRVARKFKVAFLAQPLAKHRRHPSNTGLHFVPRDQLPEVELWRQIVALYPDLEHDYGDIIRAKCAFHYLLTGVRYYRRGNYRRAVRMIASIAQQKLGIKGAWQFVKIVVKFLDRQRVHRRAEAARS
jgi:glycosyltransferase involved in cell wall biosynthesis